MKLWLVRHGETQANVEGLYSGHAPTPLTPKGITQATTLGTLLQHIPFDRVMCSELERTQHTARLLLGDRPLRPDIVPQLNEMFFGDWEMRHHRDLIIEDEARYSAWCNNWQNAIPTNGEGFQAFSERVNAFIGHLPTLNDQHLLVVSHQGVLSLLTALLLKMPPAAMWHFRIDQGAWSMIEFTPEFTMLRVLNSRAVWQPDAG